LGQLTARHRAAARPAP